MNALLCLYVLLLCNFSAAELTVLESYEYIVVGSGAGGGPLAARLALAGHKVLLIDAGDDEGDSPFEQVPVFNSASTEFNQMQWNYFVDHWDNTTQQEKDTKLVWQTPSGGEYVGIDPPKGSTKKGIWYPRAGTLGGCGQHNALISVYPHNSDWDGIASLTGDQTWSSANMRQYFEQLEDIHYPPPSLRGHGTHGWLGSTLPDLNLIAADQQLLSLITSAANAFGAHLKRILSGVKELNQVISPDINSADPGRDARQGLYEYAEAITGAKRSGPRDFIVSVVNATNPNGSRKYHLDVRLNCLVTKVLLGTDKDGMTKAFGLNFLDGKSLYSADPRWNSSSAGLPGHVNATKEVIISAGTFNTPQLLKLSGIGPKDELSALGIPTVVNLPGVGTNMMDRYEIGVIGEAGSDFEYWNGCTFGSPPDPCLNTWQSGNGTNNGAYANNGVLFAMVKKSNSTTASDPADLIIGGAPIPFKGYYPRYSSDAVKTKREFTWVVLKGHTRNHAGTVTLRSADPRDTPVIRFRYLNEGTTAGGADQLDLEAMAEGVLLARQMFETSFPVNGSGFNETWPGPSVGTKDQVKEWLRNEMWGHHASCSCPIGADGDPMAVLDSKFRVRGVKGLRVVDASVFPKIPGFFIVVSVYMISEKAAADILGGK